MRRLPTSTDAWVAEIFSPYCQNTERDGCAKPHRETTDPHGVGSQGE